MKMPFPPLFDPVVVLDSTVTIKEPHQQVIDVILNEELSETIDGEIQRVVQNIINLHLTAETMAQLEVWLHRVLQPLEEKFHKKLKVHVSQSGDGLISCNVLVYDRGL